MIYPFDPQAPTTVPIENSDAVFPVRRVYCVGRNYAAHVREMGFDPARESPFFFCKPADAIVAVAAGTVGSIDYPAVTTNFQYEIELVAAIGKRGRDISVETAKEHVWGYAVGIDMTRRDLQLEARDQGRPWEVGKAFDQSGPIGPLFPAEQVGHSDRGAIWIKVDDQDRQRSDLAHLIWSVPEIVSNLSRLFDLRPGDLIFTGTPEGIGPVAHGQTMRGGIDGLGELVVKVA